MKRHLSAILIGINAALAVTLAWLWLAPSSQQRSHWAAPPPRSTDYEALVPPLGKPQFIDQREFLAMLDRPLFSITRRPPPPPAPAPTAAAEPPPDHLSTATLSGMYAGNGVGGIIINFNGKDKSVPLNGQLEGWTLKSLADNRAYFARGGETRMLTLKLGKLGNTAEGNVSKAANASPGSPPQAPARRSRRFR